ncbi:hypothetical protein [Desulfonema magnum]|uniref:Uncharacterized protein n=1 Tax=Desulfonema magnum TaxID=45655 RepID=A0A975BHK5_9BACT|nr:hypothetical protein [Desulfonema magnum]QTA85506.1 Uncharacterized protein dnm_015170 [Desulfonema magnum]
MNSYNSENSYGTWIYDNGIQYYGQVCETGPHGTGKYLMLNGEIYEGNSILGSLNGCVKYTSPNGEESLYHFELGKRVRQIFAEDLAKKYGQITYWDGRQYCGDLQKAIPEGDGMMKYPDGSRCYGSFQEGLCQSGMGKFPDGSEYHGDFYISKIHGDGAWTSADGTILRGKWNEGLLNGKALRISPDGQIYLGDYKDCCLIDEKPIIMNYEEALAKAHSEGFKDGDSLPYTFYNNLILFYKLYVTQVPFMIDD